MLTDIGTLLIVKSYLIPQWPTNVTNFNFEIEEGRSNALLLKAPINLVMLTMSPSLVNVERCLGAPGIGGRYLLYETRGKHK